MWAFLMCLEAKEATHGRQDKSRPWDFEDGLERPQGKGFKLAGRSKGYD